MIITLKLKNTDASSGELLIIDNCRDLRITLINNEILSKEIDSKFEKLSLMQDYVCKKFYLTVNTEFKQYPNLLEFNSNGKNYYIITEQTVYIANDFNKTIQVLN